MRIHQQELDLSWIFYVPYRVHILGFSFVSFILICMLTGSVLELALGDQHSVILCCDGSVWTTAVTFEGLNSVGKHFEREILSIDYSPHGWFPQHDAHERW